MPKPIGGSGNIQIMAPPSMGAPNKNVAIIIMIIPTNIRTKPNKNSLSGGDHWKDSNEISRLRLV